MEISFSKYHGAGNDFIFIDNRDARYKLSKIQRERLCHRNFGIGADGLLEIQSSDAADFKLMYFNSDGVEGSLCGNGSRCAIAFALKIGVRKRQENRNKQEVLNSERRFDRNTQCDKKINTIGRNVTDDEPENKKRDEVSNGMVLEKVEMCSTQDDDDECLTFEAYDGLHIGGVADDIVTGFGNHGNMFFVDIKDIEFDKVKFYDSGDIYMDTGSPHHLTFVDGPIESVDVVKQGRETIHELYEREGSNINFVSRSRIWEKNVALKLEDQTKVELNCNVNVDKNVLFVRTFERGVNGETLACGTGCVAVAIADYIRGMKRDTTASSDVTLVPKCNVNCDNSGKTNNEEGKIKTHREKRTMKVLGGCIFVTFTVNQREESESGGEITFSGIKLAGPVEHVFDGICTI